MKLTLQRHSQTDTGTFGILKDEQGTLGVTCEKPPTDDHPCIIAGLYNFKPFVSPHNGPCFLCTNPPLGRDMIEVHAANIPPQLRGCVAVGEAITDFQMTIHGVPYDGPGVTNSKATLNMLRTQFPSGFDLEIIDP